MTRKSNPRIGSLAHAVAAAVALIAGFANAAGAATLYVAEYPNTQRVGSANLDGTGVNPSFLTVSGGNPIDVAVDAAANRIYFTRRTGGAIGVATLSGTVLNESLIASSAPQGLAIDVAGQRLYWIDAGLGTLNRANTNGTGATTLFGGMSGGSIIAQGLDIDPVNNKFYVALAGTGTIYRGNLDGTGSLDTTTLVTGASSLDGVDLDLVNNKIYWASSTGNNIGKGNLIGALTPNNSFVTGTNGSLDVEVDPVGGRVFWSNNNNGSVGRSDLAGAGVNQSFITGLGRSWGLATDVGVVPEPASLGLLGVGCLGLLARRRRVAVS